MCEGTGYRHGVGGAKGIRILSLKFSGRLSYDAWGRMRNLDGSKDSNCPQMSQSASTRGFTGQEQMASMCLVNMNARIYDPEIGRFMSADAVIQNPDDLQDLNRYSYVGNNPLAFTDPSGNCVGGIACFFAFATFGLLEPIMEMALRAFPLLGDLVVIAAGLACGPLGPVCSALASATAAAGVAGAEGGHTRAVLTSFCNPATRYRLRRQQSFSPVGMRYFVPNHLGSVAVITTETGLVLTDGLGNPRLRGGRV